MKLHRPRLGHRACALAAALACLGTLSQAFAARVGAPAPSASSVQAAIPQPAAQQNDESASLRSGPITALGAGGERLQVQGIWLDVADGRTQVLRAGKPARLDSLKVGDRIRFMLAPGAAEPPTIRVIYAP